MKKISLYMLAVTLFFSPLFASAQSDNLGLQRQGIFDCNQNGAYAMSVGSLGATGGVYVPVADAAVELNTGVLVYKECVLREMINRMREQATAGLGKKAVTAIQTGRNGGAQYVRNIGPELVVSASDPAFLSILKDGSLSTLATPLQGPVTRSLVRNYETQTRSPQNALTCPYQGDLAAFQQSGTLSSDTFFTDFWAASQPQCNALIASSLAWQMAEDRVSKQIQYQQSQWNWGRGYYPVVDSTGNVVTPAATVQESFQAILDSPVHQLESANDIGQMINALYAGMTTQILSDNQGLAGITQSIGGQPSYIDRVVQEASQGLRDAASNLAMQNLLVAQKVEAAYLQTVNGIASALTTAIQQLRSAENQCWDLIIYKSDGHPEHHVCSGPLAADNTCTSSAGACTVDPTTGVQTCPTGSTLKVATSTAFSQPIIDSQIAPIATSTVARIKASQNALNLIDQLIKAVTGASLDAQQLALVQLSNLVAQKLLHIQPDIDGPNGVQKQLDSVQTAMLGSEGLIASTIKLWADSETIPPGWCNVNKPAVLDAWKKCWDKNNPDKSACPTP